MTIQNPKRSYAAVVLYYKLGSEFRKTLEHLLTQSLPPSQVVVVDNASGDNYIKTVTSDFPDVIFYSSDENLGYGKGMNVGFSMLTVEVPFVLYLTHEVKMSATCVENLVEAALHTQPAPSQLGPRLFLTGGENVWSHGGVVNRFGGVSHLTSQSARPDVDWLDGACTLVRVESATAVGGWNERFFLYWEDVEYSIRLSQVGTIVCVPTASAHQDTATSPIYFGSRNRILTWRIQKDTMKLVLSCIWLLGQFVAKDGLGLSQSRRHIAQARLKGLIDGFSSALSPKYFRARETRRR